MAYRRVGEGSESVVELAVGQIRQRIRAGDYVPGQRLVASELSIELPASVNAVREALTRLAGEGLLEIQPHRGAVVRTQSRDDIIEIFELREVIEGLIARLAAQAIAAGTGDGAPLKAAVARCQALADAADFFEYARANQAFHEAIYTLAGKERIVTLAEQLSVQIDRLNSRRLARVSVLKQSSHEHDEIAAAILSGNAAAAEAAMRQHVVNSGDKVTGEK